MPPVVTSEDITTRKTKLLLQLQLTSHHHSAVIVVVKDMELVVTGPNVSRSVLLTTMSVASATPATIMSGYVRTLDKSILHGAMIPQPTTQFSRKALLPMKPDFSKIQYLTSCAQLVMVIKPTPMS